MDIDSDNHLESYLPSQAYVCVKYESLLISNNGDVSSAILIKAQEQGPSIVVLLEGFSPRAIPGTGANVFQCEIDKWRIMLQNIWESILLVEQGGGQICKWGQKYIFLFLQKQNCQKYYGLILGKE